MMLSPRMPLIHSEVSAVAFFSENGLLKQLQGVLMTQNNSDAAWNFSAGHRTRLENLQSGGIKESGLVVPSKY